MPVDIVTQSNTIRPFSLLFSEAFRLLVSKFVKLIITSFFTSLLSPLIIFVGALPVAIFTLFVIESSDQSEIAFSLFLLACALVFFGFTVFYQIGFKFRSALLVLIDQKSVLDSVGTSLIGSLGVTLANIVTFSVVFGLMLLNILVGLWAISISKFLLLLVWPIGVLALFLAITLLLVPFIAVLENKRAFAAVKEVYVLTTGHVFKVIGNILMFYFVILSFALVANYLLGAPFDWFASLFNSSGRLNMFISDTLPSLLTVILVFSAVFLKLAFLYTLYKELRLLNPQNQAVVPFKLKLPIWITSFVGMFVVYLMILGVTTLSFYVLKPRAIVNQLKATSGTLRNK